MRDRSLKSWCMMAFFACLLLLGAGGAWAQGPEGEEAGVASAPHDAEFQAIWGERRAAMAAGDTIGERQLEEIFQRKLDRGITNLWEYAISLIQEGMALKDKELAVRLGEFAQRLAPDLPAVYFYTGHGMVKSNKWKLSAALEKNAEGINAYTRNITLAAGQVINILYIVGLGVLLAIVTFCLVVFFKRLPIYFYILKEELNGATQTMIKGVGRIFLLALPLLLQLNIVWCVLAWCLILWRYLTKGEKAAVVASLFLAVYIHPVGESLFQFMDSPRAQVVFDIYEASYGERQPQAMERLRLWVEEHPEDRDALFTAALASKREGGYAEARRYYQQLVKLNPSDARSISNFGNLSMALGDPAQASSLYRQAIELAPSNGIYYFNLSKALSQKSMLIMQDADQNFQKAKELSPQIIGDHLEIDSPHPNRMVIDTVITVEHLRRRFLGEFWRETGLSYFIVDVWLHDLSPRLPFVVPIFFVVAIIVLSFMGKGRREWWRCSQCGIISNQTLGKREGMRRFCVRCFRILKGKEIDQELKESKLRETKAFQQRMGIYDKLFLLLVPGVGHIWKGYNVSGFFYLSIFFIFLVRFSYWQGIVPPPIPSSTYGMFGGLPLTLVAFILFYLAVLRGGYKKQGLEISKPSFSLEGIKR
ncbi:MAG TPA: tetratricopeptide repeat protein [Thermodesulfobacteriota bacterium]